MTKKEIMLLISGLEPSLFEIVPDDKEEAYSQGYNDALKEVIGLIRRIKE